MNDRQLDPWLSAAFDAPVAEMDPAALAEHVIRRARRYSRMRLMSLIASALVGLGCAALIIELFMPLSTAWTWSVNALQDFLRSIAAARFEPVAVLCLLLSGIAAVRALREY